MWKFFVKRNLLLAAVAVIAYHLGSRRDPEVDRPIVKPVEKRKTLEKRRKDAQKRENKALAQPPKILAKQSRKAAKYSKNSVPRPR